MNEFMTNRYARSQELFETAKQLFPGGVNSPVRAFRGVGGNPLFIERGEGAYFWDADGNQYIDYVLSWGPLLVGHAHPNVVEAVAKQAKRGTSFGAPTALEIDLAEAVIRLIPEIELIRFVNSGTEATMSALRLARAVTGRSKILKFAGCYHGHADMLLVQAGSGVATLGLPDSPGVTATIAADTLIAEFNDIDAVKRIFADQGNEIAAVIVEPVAGNMGFLMPDDDFLPELRKHTHYHGALLILDEVMTGFRIAAGGAQALWKCDPDLICLGKVIGGGLPVGAYAGKRVVMQNVAPAGPMYQAGTLSGNPLAMAAGLSTLRAAFGKGGPYSQDTPFTQAVERTEALADGLRTLSEETGIPMQVGNQGTMFGFYFLKSPDVQINNYAEAKKYADPQRYAKFFWEMVDRGVYLAPSQFEAGFISTVHTDADIDATLAAAHASLLELGD